MMVDNLKVRQYIYGLLIALGPVAVYYGLASDQELVIWLAVAAEMLGFGLALANPTKPEQDAPDKE